jgi:hypothetical protein
MQNENLFGIGEEMAGATIGEERRNGESKQRQR